VNLEIDDDPVVSSVCRIKSQFAVFVIRHRTFRILAVNLWLIIITFCNVNKITVKNKRRLFNDVEVEVIMCSNNLH
jgi:hypothetical protein